MCREDILKYIDSSNLTFKKDLKDFLEYYFKVVDLIKKEIEANLLHTDEIKIAEKLFEWLDVEGYKQIYTSLTYLEENMKDYVLKFINCHVFLLKLSQPDERKVIDHLFSIPGKMEKEFLERKGK